MCLSLKPFEEVVYTGAADGHLERWSWVDFQAEASTQLFCDGIYCFHGHDASAGDAEEVFGVELFDNDIQGRIDDVFLTFEGNQVVVLVFREDVGDARSLQRNDAGIEASLSAVLAPV